MELSFDINKTKAILIGTSEFENFQEIPPIKNNLHDFKEILANENIIGISEKDNIFILPNLDNNKTLKEIKKIINNPDFIDFNTLIIYFTGHGYRKRWNKELYLASKNSDIDITTSFIHFNELKETIENSHFQNRILIIDACHSGLAAQSEANEKFDESEITIKASEIKAENKGTYVITSSSGSEKSLFDRNERHTFFTGELIRFLKNGTSKKIELIDLDNIFTNIQNQLIQMNLPKPQRKSTFNYPTFYFCKNVYYPFALQRENKKIKQLENEYSELFDLLYLNDKISDKARKILLKRQKDLKIDNVKIKQIENRIIKKHEKKRNESLKTKIEQLQQKEWIECKTKNTINDYYLFIDKFKKGESVALAYIQINNLKEIEKQDYKKVEQREKNDITETNNVIEFELPEYEEYFHKANDANTSKEQIEYYKKAISIKPDYENAYFELSLVYHKQGNINLEKKMLEKVISLNPNNAAAYNNLALCYF